MPLSSQRKNKIILSDYNYKRDIEIRLLLADLTVYEVNVLREILNNSLVIPLKQIVEILETTESKIIPILQKFIPSKLLKIEGNTLFVDKEMRKYYEGQIIKFDDDFEPGMEFLQGLLSKIPIHHLTQWYSIPRTSDYIFQYLIDKFFALPKTYEKYLQEIQLDHAILHQIVDEVFKSHNFIVTAQFIKDKYHLTSLEWEEYVLYLEYNFVCCLSYQKNGDYYEEVITPFHEWREYLRFQKDFLPKPIKDVSKIIPKHPEEFGFVLDMSHLLKMALKKPVCIDTEDVFPHFSSDYFQSILKKIQFHHLGEIKHNKLYAYEIAQEWLEKPLQNRALTFSRHPIKIEKSLKCIIDCGWVYVDDFIESFTGAIHGKEPIHLKQKGKRWKYVLPTYSDEEKALIETTLCERLFEAGMIAVGMLGDRKCFKVTSFGRMTLED